MAEKQLLTAGKIAKELGVSDARVKKAIKELGLEPSEKKGACCYYDAAQIAKIKKAV
ncbi:MAG: HTH domain-containing protein [Pseudomonadota bacterium]